MTTIELRFREALDRYVEHGIPTGSFLAAVLANDLFGAWYRADAAGRANFPLIMDYIYNEFKPSYCWGSPEAVAIWIGHGGRAGMVTAEGSDAR